MIEHSPETLLEMMAKAARRYAIKKAQYDYLENYRKHLVCALMKDSSESTVSAQEREAFASESYLTHIRAIKDAQIEAANAHHHWIECQTAIEIWRTQQANERIERRTYGT